MACLVLTAFHLCAGVVAKIARVGHPVLLEKCTPVQDPTSQETQAIVAHMCATLVIFP